MFENLSNYEKIIIAVKRKNKNFSWLADELKITKQNLNSSLKNIKSGKGTVDSLKKIGEILEIKFEI